MVERILARMNHFARFFGAFARLCRDDSLLNHDLRRRRILFEVFRQIFAENGRDNPFDFRVAKLRLRLTLEERFRHADGNDRRQSLAEIFARGRNILEKSVALTVFVQNGRQRAAKSGEMRASFDRMNVVHVSADRLVVAGGILKRDVDMNAVLRSVRVNDVWMRDVFSVQIVDKIDDPASIVKFLATSVAKIAEHYVNTRVKERKILKSVIQDVVVVFNVDENLMVRFEGRLRAVLMRRGSSGDVARRDSAFIFLIPREAVATHLDVAPFRKEIDDRNADSMQTAGRLIRPLGELAAELQHRHNALERRNAKVGVNVDRDAAAVVLDRDRSVRIHRHGDSRRVARERFVKRVVDDFVHQMVQSLRSDVAYVHRRTHTNMLAVVKVLHVLGGVRLVRARSVVDEFFDASVFRRVSLLWSCLTIFALWTVVDLVEFVS